MGDLYMALNESGEMYLETIYVLYKSRSEVRSVDIAEHMNYTRASVSRGVGLLKKQGLIEVNNSGYISLSEQGMKAAKNLWIVMRC